MKNYVSLVAIFLLTSCNSGSSGSGGGNGAPDITTKGSQFFTPEETLTQPSEIEQKGYACGVTSEFQPKIDSRLRAGTQFVSENRFGDLRALVKRTVRSVTPETLIYDGITTDMSNPNSTSPFTETHVCKTENGKTTCQVQSDPTARIHSEIRRSLESPQFYSRLPAPRQDECERQTETSTSKFFGGKALVAGIGYRGLRIELTNTYKIICPDGTTSNGNSTIVAVLTKEIASSSPTSCSQIVYAWIETVEPKQSMKLEYQLTGFTP